MAAATAEEGLHALHGAVAEPDHRLVHEEELSPFEGQAEIAFEGSIRVRGSEHMWGSKRMARLRAAAFASSSATSASMSRSSAEA